MWNTNVRRGALASLLHAIVVSGQRPDAGYNGTTGFPPCDALLTSGVANRVLLPSSPEYEPRVQSYWVSDARLHPWCFFLPQTTDELSTGIKALHSVGDGAGDWAVAIRSGGHMYPGSNNIVNGVTIDLGYMNASWYDGTKKLASVQPGGRWRDVYRNLLKTANVTVTGGRDGDVGVGGFLLGGGNSYYSGKNGFACDTVANFEVVLADGSIVEANKTAHPELYKALRGGGTNFGVVSRFDLLAMPAMDLAYGQSVIPADHADEVLDAVLDFTNHAEQTQEDHLIVIYVLTGSGDGVFLAIRVNTSGNLKTTSFEGITKLPALKESWNRISLADAANASQLQSGESRGTAFTLTLINSPNILRKSKQLLDEVVRSLSSKVGAENITAQAFFQPLPLYYGELGRKDGGNVLGLDRTGSNAILWIGGIGVIGGDAAVALVYAELGAMVESLKAFAAKEAALADFVYLNYADPSQDPLGSYGPENVEFLKEVAARYDPDGWLQRMVPGGFKISRIG